jgi:hypothetical protein
MMLTEKKRKVGRQCDTPKRREECGNSLATQDLRLISPEMMIFEPHCLGVTLIFLSSSLLVYDIIGRTFHLSSDSKRFASTKCQILAAPHWYQFFFYLWKTKSNHQFINTFPTFPQTSFCRNSSDYGDLFIKIMQSESCNIKRSNVGSCSSKEMG